jgi:hypothetical protein
MSSLKYLQISHEYDTKLKVLENAEPAKNSQSQAVKNVD